MRWNILHVTRYQYATPARDSFNVVRLQPMTTEQQTVEQFELKVTPAARVRHYLDFYSNVTHHFEIPDPHQALTIEGVLTARNRAPWIPAQDAALFPLRRIGEAASGFRCYEFLNASTYVDLDPATCRLALDAIDGCDDVWQAALAVLRFMQGYLAYLTNSTTVHTHMREVLARRQGVCQDFAHVALGLYRALRIPALYVSGYLATESASATHAWVEVFIPGVGWCGLDPTHNRPVDENYLKIAVGRDYDDVAPVTGHYKGSLDRKMEVTVTIKTEV